MNRFSTYLLRVLLAALLLAGTALHAETYVIRYVNAETGRYANDGSSWAQAKNNLQNTIDELEELLKEQADTKGYVYVAGSEEGMKYVPTRRSTENVDGSMFNTSFRIYANISVFGGFKGDEEPTEDTPEERLHELRMMTNGSGEAGTYKENQDKINHDNIEGAVRRWNFLYKTILSGNHSAVSSVFTFDVSRGRYNMSFPLNSYHVVWFGTNGEIQDDAQPGHFRPLDGEAVLDGCTVQEGNAAGTAITTHGHNGYGGGVYMVKGAVLRNCIVRNCAATIRGGGVYLDGGGTVERCYIHSCQATGIGVQQGYGGAVCIDYDGAVEHSFLTQSCARVGAGLAICHVPGEYPYASVGDGTQISSYQPYAVATVISNCTSNAEGGGVYLDEGGTLNHCSVVRNKCVGPDVIYYGRRHGRTGGIYVRTCGTVYNSVAWGNESPVNSDIQFASFKEADATASDKIEVYHSAFSRHDITDWSNATKEAVVSLDTANFPTADNHAGNYACFRTPTEQAGVQYNEDGSLDYTATADGQPYQKVYNWHPLASSALRLKAVQVTDALQGIGEEVLHAHTTVDVVGRQFEAVSSAGALAHSYRTISWALVKSQEKNEDGQLWPTIFVDPNRVVYGPENVEASDGSDDGENGEDGGEAESIPASTGYLDSEPVGNSWTHPAGNLPDAIMFFKQVQQPDGTYLLNGETYEHVQILVKQGEITPAGTGSYLGTQARTASIRPASNMRLYGGYSSAFEGTDTDGRNQRRTPTYIRANVLNSDYQNNSAHVIALSNVHDVIIDGFRLYSGNANLAAHHSYSDKPIAFGGGVIVNNATANEADRIDMTGNVIRNCVFANCSAPEGGTVFVNGGYKHPTAGRLCRAELTLVNTIMRNSTAGDTSEDPDRFLKEQTDGGIVTASGNAFITVRNCDIVNNCGYALKAVRAADDGLDSVRGQVRIYNSVLFSNGRKIQYDRRDIGQAVSCLWTQDNTISGDYIFMDYDAPKPAGLPESIVCRNVLTRVKSQDMTSIERDGQTVTLRYPYFVNPSRNVGHSVDYDQPLYGGVVNYEPLNMNPLVNGANPNMQRDLGAFDTDFNLNFTIDYDSGDQPRTYGGDPDAGAIENTRLPKVGTIIYVTPDGAGRRDGSSWSNAIQGNAVYALNGASAAGTDQLDEANQTTRIINSTNDGSATTGAANGVLTTDNRYCGGFGIINYTKRQHTTTTTTTTNITYKSHITTDGIPSYTEETRTTQSIEDPVVEDLPSTVTPAPDFPYGEISGQSRSFWRSTGNVSPIGVDWRAGVAYADDTRQALADSSTIGNDRTENYVSGLQWAVETAAAYNVLDENDIKREEGIDSVQVWVGNGTYTDYKGYVMRNKTTVLGGFPAVMKDGTLSTPGLAEREALLSATVDIPNKEAANGQPASDYETILQISDVNPRQTEGSFNKEAAKFWDADYTDISTVKISKTRKGTSERTVAYTTTGVDFTSKITNADFKDTPGVNGGVNKCPDGWTEVEPIAGFNVRQTITKGDWTVIGETGSYGETGKTYRGGHTIYWPRERELSGLRLYQELSEDIPAGKYELFAAFQLRKATVPANNMGLHLFAITSDGNTNVSPDIIRTWDLNQMKFVHFEFEQTETGKLTIGFMVDNDSPIRDVGCSYFHLKQLLETQSIESTPVTYDTYTYEIVDGEERTVEATDVLTETTTSHSIEKNDEYTTLRKRVLFMPDVTMPNWSPGRPGNTVRDGSGTETFERFAHTYREAGHMAADPDATDAKLGFSPIVDPNLQVYKNVMWDGFTIRHGFIYEYAMNHGGGAGVSMFSNATLSNCIITDNMYVTEHRGKGSGIFIDGLNAVVQNCFILNNSIYQTKNAYQQIYAGGMFMYDGTCFNSLIANNYSATLNGTPGASGVGLCVGKFYNNTVAYNKGDNGVGIATRNAVPSLMMANSIVYGNEGTAVGGSGTILPFLHCYIQSATAITSGDILNAINEASNATQAANYPKKNQFFNGVAPSAETTPFAADLDEDGNYTGLAAATNDFRLHANSSEDEEGNIHGCVNTGLEDFESRVGTSTSNNPLWRLIDVVKGVTLPPTDVAYDDRVQDCTVDIGAYEYDGAKDIEPDLKTDPTAAIYYVTTSKVTGLATANSPKNATCVSKIQKVLDAAGRWKYAANYYDATDADGYSKNITNFTEDVLRQELEDIGITGEAQTDSLHNLRNRTVIVKLAGSHDELTKDISYVPVRSTATEPNVEDNLLEYSLIVPHGVQVWGGYDDDFTDDTRDVITNMTRLNGSVSNVSSGATGNVFHVVTFTDNLFTPKERLYETADGEQLFGQLADLENEKDRAVLDGLFVINGEAVGSDQADRVGGACVVTSYGHVRNCIIQDNQASELGGGLYLKPGALVSGSIIKQNSAEQGGGIYVEEPDEVNDDTYAHLFTSTIVGNTATNNAGGLWFLNNLRINSTAIWKNSANDLANVAGNFNSGLDQTAGDYPFSYSAIESRRVAGVNNVDLSPTESYGVRWDHYAKYEAGYNEGHNGGRSGEIRYYPISMSSVLARAGMTYGAYRQWRSIYPTLELADLAGLNRMEQAEEVTDGEGNVIKVHKDNAFIEIGARVLNKSFEVIVDPQYVMKRLYVANTEILPSDEAYALQENKNTDDVSNMYRQMGSTFMNPFHRLGDAFEYIIKVRRSTDEIEVDGKQVELGEAYRNTRFEVFVTNGTFYPFRDAQGDQGNVRTNTFVIPEMTSLVGGVDNQASGHSYCQLTAGSVSVPVSDVPGFNRSSIGLNGVSTTDIRHARTRQDRNGNNVMEPWELSRQTILSGNAVNLNAKTNVFHVITCFSDESQVGKLPRVYDSNGNEVPDVTSDSPTQAELLTHLQQESTESRYSRLIVIDGVTITEGHANDISEADVEEKNYNQLTYFRGGGILVEGNWDESFNEKGDLPEVLGVAKRDIPLLVTNTIFQNNMAGNGGGIYSNGTLNVASCFFTQNWSEGPNDEVNQRYIPWTAGGAIATNYECNVWNTLFSNNEARRGDVAITNGTITNADNRQGYGGVISSSETSVVRAGNCDFVRNKAVAFPAIYNFLDNATRTSDPANYGPGRHYAVNCLFWGNEATATQVAAAIEDVKESGSTTDRRLPNHVANFGRDMDQEVLWFSAYEPGNGLTAHTPARESDRNAAKRSPLIYLDESKTLSANINTLKEGAYPIAANFGTYTDEDGTIRAYNHNQTINRENTASDGPFFVQPSSISGIDGYMENADWLVSRLNVLIDNGWGYLEQRVVKPDLSSPLLTTRFVDKNEQPIDNAGNETANLFGDGFYNAHSKLVYEQLKNIGFDNLLPIADEPYMEYTRSGESDSRIMRRISTHPKQGLQQVFVDIGIYEYQFVQLSSLGSEVDVIWVTESENTSIDCDGSTWTKATSNLQEAIEILLASRNNHDKIIKLREGEYSPSPDNITSNNKQGFLIKTPDASETVTLPSSPEDNLSYGVKSLTFRGGYSNATIDDMNDGEVLRDPELHPVVIKMRRYANNSDDQLDHLFIIEDAEQKVTYANFIEDKNRAFEDYVMPIVFDGLTLVNTEARWHQENLNGAAIYYGSQYKTTEVGESVTKTDQLLYDSVGSAPKLTIKDCKFVANGAKDEPVSAVYVGQGGGRALVTNSLFHTNAGTPIDAVGTQVLNCTFALNGSHLNLSAATGVRTYNPATKTYQDLSIPSELHNSIVWKDDQSNSQATQWTVNGVNSSDADLSASYSYVTYNAVTRADAEPDGNTEDDPATHNFHLSKENADVMLGPNFKNPAETFADGMSDDEKLEQIMNRNFNIGPSRHLISQASDQVYLDRVPYFAETSTAEERTAMMDGVPVKYIFQSVQRSDPQPLTRALLQGTGEPDEKTGVVPAERELAFKPRLTGEGVERGAYECTAAIERVLYVSEAQGKSGNDGLSWENAYPLDELQNAIDVASIYSLTSPTNERAYVFVKASNVVADPVKVRDGVSVFGGLRLTFDGMAEKTDCEGVGENRVCRYSELDINRYVSEVLALRGGVAARNATVSKVGGLVNDNSNTHRNGFLLDGFVIEGGTGLTASPVVMEKDQTVIRNSVITATSMNGSSPVVDLRKGLLYNTLLYGNKAETLVQVGADGYVLNCTAVAANAGETAISTGSDNSVVNTITWNLADQSLGRTDNANYFKHCNTLQGSPFAPYLNAANAYPLPDYLTSHEPYHYQLHERSAALNTGIGTDSKALTGLPEWTYNSFDFQTDRDALGNPRLLDQTVDLGCFEAWNVTREVYATSVIPDDDDLWSTSNVANEPSHPASLLYNSYPHAGSVVYLRTSGSLHLDLNAGQPRFSSASPMRPGYLLVEDGASLYTNGNHFQAAYVAAERRVSGRYSLLSMPFGHDLQHTVSTTYDASTDQLTQALTADRFTSFYYDGLARSQWRYGFRDEDSPCWQPLTTTARDATIGWLLDQGEEYSATTYRFTAWGESNGDYVYTEDGTDKTVSLTQYDDRTSTAGQADYTSDLDMGWNLRGLPYLISDYKTYDSENSVYMMNVPHLIYSMNPDGTYDYFDATGSQFFTKRSWDGGTTLSMSEAFFTQTAVIGDEETLTFRLPVELRSIANTAYRPIVIVTDPNRHGDAVTLNPSTHGSLDFTLGSDGLKWMALTDDAPQLYILGNNDTRLSLLSGAPVEVEMWLGLKVGQGGSYTISLPEPEGFSPYTAVWLTDYQTHQVVNLMEQSYTVNVSSAGDYSGRLTIKIGGRQPSPAGDDRYYSIYMQGDRLHIDNLRGTERVGVYTLTGSTLINTTSAGSHFTTTLPRGLYVVAVDGTGTKVLSRGE